MTNQLFSKGIISIVMIIFIITLGTTVANAKSKRYSKSHISTPTCDRYPKHILNKKASKYIESITESASDYHVSPHLITAIITVESCFRQRVRSPKGAAGLMQLMPATAKRFGTSRKKRYNSKYNIRAGTRYLKFLLKRYHGNIALTAAAYNAGEGAVAHYNGIPPYQETQQYVRKVLAVYKKLANYKKPKHVMLSNYSKRIRHQYNTNYSNTSHQRSRAWYISQFKYRQNTRNNSHNSLSSAELRIIRDLLY